MAWTGHWSNWASQFNLIHPASGLKVGFIVYSETEFNQSRMARSRALPVLEDLTRVFFC